MKVTENGKKLWSLLFSLLVVLLFCRLAFFLEEKNAGLRVQKEQLHEEWEEMMKRKEIRDPEEEIRDSRLRLEMYPLETGSRRQLEFIMDLEREFGISVSSMHCGEPELLMESEEWCLTGSRLEFSAELSLEQWGQMIEYILNCREKSRILEQSYRPDPVRNTGTAAFCVYRYGRKEELP